MTTKPTKPTKTETKKKKKTAKRKQKYQHRFVVITANNMLATLEQEALIHPLPNVRRMSAEAIPVLRDILSRLRATEMPKNEVLNMISHHKTDTHGGAALLPHLRTPITSCNLDTILEVRTVDDVIGLLTEQQQDMIYVEEIPKLETEWALNAANICKDAGVTNINLTELLGLSRQGVMSTYKG